MQVTLRSWLEARIHMDMGKATSEEASVLENHGIDSILKEISSDHKFGKEFGLCLDLQSSVEETVVRNTDGSIINYLTNYSEVIGEKVRSYFKNTSPENWSLELLEMVSVWDNRCDMWKQFDWWNDRAASLEQFKRFMKGPIQDTGCSDELYRTLFITFMNAFKMFSLWDHMGENFFMEGPSPELVRGVIKMAHNGVYLSDFECYIKN